MDLQQFIRFLTSVQSLWERAERVQSAPPCVTVGQLEDLVCSSASFGLLGAFCALSFFFYCLGHQIGFQKGRHLQVARQAQVRQYLSQQAALH